MKAANKKRRSERVPAAHRLMLIVQGPSGAAILKDIVTTVEISRHGTLVRGRQPLEPDWTGTLIKLSSCRQIPFRVAYQGAAPGHPGYFDAGLEILTATDFWGRSFSHFAVQPDASDVLIENARVSPAELLEELRKASAPEGEKMLEALWCGLVEQLEERRVFTRTELVSTLRQLALSTPSR